MRVLRNGRPVAEAGPAAETVRDPLVPNPQLAGVIFHGNYSAGMADVRQGGTIGSPAKTLVNASMTLPPFLRMVEM